MIADVIFELSTQKCADINLNAEGPCSESLGLYHMLDEICEKFNFPKNKVTIHTWNQIEHHQKYNIKINPPLYINETQEFNRKNQIWPDKIFDPISKHFGIFIGRSNWIRLWIAGNLWHNYKDKTVMTYHWKINNEFHAAHIGLDDMLRWNASIEDVDRSNQLLKHCPLDLSEHNVYPILSPEHLNICRIYHQFFLEIICETYYSGVSFYPTEKIWRPILMKTPFLIHGPVEYLKNLRNMGFKTFDKWWSEEYDDYGHDQRVIKLLGIIEQIQKMSIRDLQLMYKDMLPILEHNYKTFMNLSPRDFSKVFGYD